MALQECVEESIRSQSSSQQFRLKDDSSSAPIVASYPDQIHTDPISTSWKAGGGADKLPDRPEDSSYSHQKQAPGPAMRRVFNPYASDQSGSFKSVGSSSSQLPGTHNIQNRSKGGKKIPDLEKASELEASGEIGASHESAKNNNWAHQSKLGNGGSQGTDDSYQDDDFESQSLSKSKDHQRLQEQIEQQEREKQNLQQRVLMNRQAAKLRQAAPSKKDAATPIKEEAIEEEMSDHESDPRRKKNKKDGIGLPLEDAGLQNGVRASAEKGNSGRQGQFNRRGSTDRGSAQFERDSRQDDLQDELQMIEE